MWWQGDERVEEFMWPVKEVIEKHVKPSSEEFTEIYNRAYEAVYNAICRYDQSGSFIKNVKPDQSDDEVTAMKGG